MTVGDDETSAAINAAHAGGVTLFDTSPFYGIGLSEMRFGLALHRFPRDSFVLSTKVGRDLVPDAAKCGASPTQVHKALQHGMGNSRVFEKWVPAMMNTDFESMGKTGMAAMKKDLSIVLESAKEFSYPMPMTALALQQFCGSTALSNTRQDAPSVVQLCVMATSCAASLLVSEIKWRRESRQPRRALSSTFPGWPSIIACLPRVASIAMCECVRACTCAGARI